VADRPIQVYRFGDGQRERLIIAGIHGGYEWNTIALADELIAHVQEHPEMIPKDVSLYILPNLNPDGEARSHGVDGRANERGVDLNRNFPALWQEDWPRSGCWDYGPTTAGSHPASEPETLAVMSFVQGHNIDALINYHSAALGIFAGGQPPDPASLDLADSIAAVSNYPYPPIDTGCQFSGQLIDWASQEGIAAVDIELTNHTDTDFEQNLAILARFLDWKMKP
jgi:g-D-glutamyl-meso-diaminopimelate peptidase